MPTQDPNLLAAPAVNHSSSPRQFAKHGLAGRGGNPAKVSPCSLTHETSCRTAESIPGLAEYVSQNWSLLWIPRWCNSKKIKIPRELMNPLAVAVSPSSQEISAEVILYLEQRLLWASVLKYRSHPSVHFNLCAYGASWNPQIEINHLPSYMKTPV